MKIRYRIHGWLAKNRMIRHRVSQTGCRDYLFGLRIPRRLGRYLLGA